MTVTDAKEILLKRIKTEENMIEAPFGVRGIYALRKAAVVLDDVEKGKLVERKKGKWIAIEEETGVEAFGFKEKAICSFQCSACRNEVDVSEGNFNFCPNCGAEMSPT